MTEPVQPAAQRGRRNEKVGQVVSTKMTKTVVVEVTQKTSHPLYRRGMTRHHRFYAHDETTQARIGDTVRIQETRPLSRLKRWRLIEVVRRAAALPTAEEITRAVGREEIERDTRKPAAPAPAAGE